MVWVELVSLLALLQLLAFGALVSRARERYGVKAPATAGNEVFERYYRVQMNTVELLILFLPSMWLCGRYWSPYLAAIGGVVYLAGRMIYLNAYVKDPASRSLGFGLSMVPILVFLLADVAGAVRILILTHGS